MWDFGSLVAPAGLGLCSRAGPDFRAILAAQRFDNGYEWIPDDANQTEVLKLMRRDVSVEVQHVTRSMIGANWLALYV